jgi:hypothetical protein
MMKNVILKTLLNIVTMGNVLQKKHALQTQIVEDLTSVVRNKSVNYVMRPRFVTLEIPAAYFPHIILL